jgi:hypothetical protein
MQHFVFIKTYQVLAVLLLAAAAAASATESLSKNNAAVPQTAVDKRIDLFGAGKKVHKIWKKLFKKHYDVYDGGFISPGYGFSSSGIGGYGHYGGGGYPVPYGGGLGYGG